MKPLFKPREELEKARAEIENMRIATDLNVLEEHWRQFLFRLERSWNKSVSHLKRSPKYQGWNERGRIEKLRKQDPLLAYLINARGADEHTIENIVGREEGHIAINPAEGDFLHINKMSIKDGVLTVDSDQSLKIDFKPAKTKLIPVNNRGRIYNPPTSHLGKPLILVDPIDIAGLGVSFYGDYFAMAEAFFVK